METCWDDFNQRDLYYYSSPIVSEKMPSQKETIVFQPSIFRCYVCFFFPGRVYNSKFGDG